VNRNSICDTGKNAIDERTGKIPHLTTMKDFLYIDRTITYKTSAGRLPRRIRIVFQEDSTQAKVEV
jgi:hypothetical protein